MSRKIINIPPILLTATLTTNLLNCNVTSLSGPVGLTLSQPFLLIPHIRFVNKDTVSRNFSIWKGGTAGNVSGTEVIGNGKVIAANDVYDYWAGGDGLRLDAADFLVGGADSASKIIMQVDAYIGISG